MINRNTPIFRTFRFCAGLVALQYVFAFAALSQTIAVTDGRESGFGWMFRNNGTCYAVLPKHVAPSGPRITVTTAAPVVTGSGTVIRPFWSDMDLALAVLRGGIVAQCNDSLDRLSLSHKAGSAARADLHRLGPTGEEQRIPIAIEARDYLTLRATVIGSDSEIYQGTSGAFAFVGPKAIGMAIKSDDPGRLELLRSEEIVMNVRRYLSEQGNAFSAATQVVPVVQDGGFAVTVASVSAPPIAPEFAPENVLGTGLYVFKPQRNAEILFRVEGDDAVPLSQVSIRAPVDGVYALPKRILILTDEGVAGDRLTVWQRGQLAQDGVFDTGPRAARNVRWIKIIIPNAWSGGNIAVGNITMR